MNTLDSAQRAAVTDSGRVRLVLAGPGSGKTTTLAGRFVHLVRQGVDRQRILALTFTKKAADDMKERIVAGARPAIRKRSHGRNVSWLYFSALCKGTRNSPDFPKISSSGTPRSSVRSSTRGPCGGTRRSTSWTSSPAPRNACWTPRASPQQIDENDETLRNAVEFFRVYENALRRAGAIDFADMVPLVVKAMDEHPAYAAAITGAYDHVLVDEYQDVNPGQVELIDRFVQAGVNFWVVGDDDQTLYAFRAADVRYILDFPQKYPMRAGSRPRPQLSFGDADRRGGQAVDRQQPRAPQQGLSCGRRRRRRDRHPRLSHAADRGAAGGKSGRQAAQARPCPAADRRPVSGRRRLGSRCSRRCRRCRSPTRCVAPAISGRAWRPGFWSGSLHYLRDGESVAAMSRMGSSRRARDRPRQARPGPHRRYGSASRRPAGSCAASLRRRCPPKRPSASGRNG